MAQQVDRENWCQKVALQLTDFTLVSVPVERNYLLGPFKVHDTTRGDIQLGIIEIQCLSNIQDQHLLMLHFGSGQ